MHCRSDKEKDRIEEKFWAAGAEDPLVGDILLRGCRGGRQWGGDGVVEFEFELELELDEPSPLLLLFPPADRANLFDIPPPLSLLLTEELRFLSQN